MRTRRTMTLAALAAALLLGGCAGSGLPTALPSTLPALPTSLPTSLPSLPEFGKSELCQKFCERLQKVATAAECDAPSGACLTYLTDAAALFAEIRAALPNEPADSLRGTTMKSAEDAIAQFKPNCSSPKASDTANVTQCHLGTTAVRAAAGALFADFQVAK